MSLRLGKKCWLYLLSTQGDDLEWELAVPEDSDMQQLTDLVDATCSTAGFWGLVFRVSGLVLRFGLLLLGPCPQVVMLWCLRKALRFRVWG